MSKRNVPLVYGAANLGNLNRPLTDGQARDILDAAWASGIRHFDTAPHYGLGLSERRVGAFLRTKNRDDYVVSTKVGRLLRANPDDDGSLDLDNGFHVRTDLRREWDFSAEGITASLDESLVRLGLDHVDIVYLHDPERYDLDAAIKQALPALEALRAAGRVHQIGVGSMSTDALAAVAQGADLDVLMIAGRYTLLEQPAADEVLPICRERGIKVVAASVFNSGLLATHNPVAEARYEYGDVPALLQTRVQRLRAICAAHGVSLPVAALAFVARQPLVFNVVIGASRPEQIRDSVAMSQTVVPTDLWLDLEYAGLIPVN